MEETIITFGCLKEFSERDLNFILMLCDKLLPSPVKACVTLAKEVKEFPVSSYLDENVYKMFTGNKYGIEYLSEPEKPHVLI